MERMETPDRICIIPDFDQNFDEMIQVPYRKREYTLSFFFCNCRTVHGR